MTSSTVSRRFIKVSKKKLAEMKARRLDGYDIVAIVIDGKVFYDDEIIVALGITVDGRKVMLGYTQAGSENSSVCKEFLKGLMDIQSCLFGWTLFNSAVTNLFYKEFLICYYSI